ncbi:uncharacterized protein TRIADDRAFT_60683 [Trichoplax adhaerens]|uniref:Major facilitator superfamily (MFS) profile domain-containing protein n=1 Tax=Trichoplax adhaerens TaxID=10228 RepID=B3S936_TRIAD|nr:hypothetical protein TRIADDRAFT_60683 [Trichoplax adhaerens]EDV20802.1 hypothetical protein TRIADDRAFT_60683 [Trichoplax adhaerens]|eukprot:XP_002116743.1 hypothetical protein TRIADDRAFT_60683 [Trichoplax adhaerens]
MGFEGLDSEQDKINDKTALLSESEGNFNCESITSSSSVDEIVDSLDIGLFHYAIFITSGLCHSGYNIFYNIVGFIVITACDIGINQSNKGWLSISFMVGIAVGSVVLGKLSDTLGRRKILIISISVYLIMIVVAAFAYNYTMLVIVASIIGFADSAMAAISGSYALEFFPRPFRGKLLGCRTAIAVIIGGLYCSLMALVILPHPLHIKLGQIHFSSWRVYLLVTNIPVLFGFCLLLYMPNSIRFAIVNKDGIKPILDKIDRINSICKRNGSSSEKLIKSRLGDIVIRGDEMDESNTKKQKGEKLYQQPWLKRLLLLSAAWMGYCFSQEGLIVWLPTVVSYYTMGKRCWHTYNQTSPSPLNHHLYTNSPVCVSTEQITSVSVNILIGNVLTIPLSIACITLVNRVGRKWLFIILVFVAVFSIAAMLIIDDIIAVRILVCVFTMVANNGWIPLATWTLELFPTHVRSTAMGILNFSAISSCILGLLGGVVSLFLPDTSDMNIG